VHVLCILPSWYHLILLCKYTTIPFYLFSVRSKCECTFVKGSYIVGLKHLCMHEWQLIFGKSWFLKCVLFFPKCLRFLVDISEDVPVFLRSIRALVIPRNKISSVMIFHCTPVCNWMLWLAVHICGTVSLPIMPRTMILIAFQDVRPVILTVFDNIAFLSSHPF